MKHIKTWHSMNVLFEGFNTDEYYTNIDIATYDELVSNTIDMSDRDIEIITKNLKYEWRQDKALLIYPDPNNKSVWVLIIELEDDWFLVDFNLTYRVGVNWGPFNRTLYKCDQIEGLLKLLKDKDYLK
jgi:hypothetical protein